MSNQQAQSALNNLLLALQLCLGLWQFASLTPVGALFKGIVGWLLRPFGLSPTYARLHHLSGRVFKDVSCYATMADAQRSSIINHDERHDISLVYLGENYLLERRGGNLLFLNGEMSYYITQQIWENLLDIPTHPQAVFVKGYKGFWEGAATGGVMTFDEVLDCLIIENHSIKLLNFSQTWLLPVDLSASEERLLKILNLVGLFFLTKKVYWLVPTLLSLCSALLEFSIPLRTLLYDKINLVFCCAMQFVCDRLSYSLRRHAYSLGNWVENLNPSNDIELKVVRGNMHAIIGGGVKTHTQGATLIPRKEEPEQQDIQSAEQEGEVSRTFDCVHFKIKCQFISSEGICHVYSSRQISTEMGYVDKFSCNREEFLKLCTFVYCLSRNNSGSLKSHGLNNKVRVRGWKESIQCYVKNKFPPVYTLDLDNVTVY